MLELPSDRSVGRKFSSEVQNTIFWLRRLVHVQFTSSGCFYGTAPALTAEFTRKLLSAVRTALYLLTVQKDFQSWGHRFKRDSQTLVSWSWNNIFSLTYLKVRNSRVEFLENQNERMRCERWAMKSLKNTVSWKIKRGHSASTLANVQKDQTAKSELQMWSISAELRVRGLQS